MNSQADKGTGIILHYCGQIKHNHWRSFRCWSKSRHSGRRRWWTNKEGACWRPWKVEPPPRPSTTTQSRGRIRPKGKMTLRTTLNQSIAVGKRQWKGSSSFHEVLLEPFVKEVEIQCSQRTDSVSIIIIAIPSMLVHEPSAPKGFSSM